MRNGTQEFFWGGLILVQMELNFTLEPCGSIGGGSKVTTFGWGYQPLKFTARVTSPNGDWIIFRAPEILGSLL